MIYKIITPNPQFTGERAGVQITCGTGVTRDPATAAELRGMGYIVTEQPEFDDVPAPAVINDSPTAAEVGAHGVRPDAAPLPAGVQAKSAKRKAKEA